MMLKRWLGHVVSSLATAEHVPCGAEKQLKLNTQLSGMMSVLVAIEHIYLQRE